LKPIADPTERAIVNGLQGGFPLTSRPFRDAGRGLGLSEGELIEGVQSLVERGRLSRFGPLWNAERLGGEVCLAAMAVPPERFETVAAQVNAHPEVAHNYERAHTLNMWFVLASEHAERLAGVMAEIAEETGLEVLPMPKTREFFVGFRMEV
jgi:DNA-binding Lrp family transcriptional regulator